MTHVANRSAQALLAAVLAIPVTAAQPEIAIEVSEDVPLEVVASNFGSSNFEPRGGALIIELDGSIRFRHTGEAAVRAVTLAVDAHGGRLGGRAAVAVPSLHARSGEEFEVYLNLRMLRPLPLPPGPAVRIAPDGVLFDTLQAVGPDRLDSVRKMTIRELEARRDRQYFLSQWESGGRTALASAIQASLRRQASRPRLDVRMAAQGPATAGSDIRELQFSFIQNEAAPLILEGGTALVSGMISDSPRIRIRNRTDETVRHFEIGWLVRDSRGAVYSAGTAPAGDTRDLRPGATVETGGDRRFELRPTGAGQPPALDSMAAYVRNAQFDDGSVWIPSRQALEASRLLQAMPVSAEERRLTHLYRERGPAVVAAELEKLTGRAVSIDQ